MIKGLRVLQLPVSYLPWTVGGKEVYTHHLSRNLQALGWDVRVAIHQNLHCREPLGEHEYEGVPVTVLPPMSGQEARTAVYDCIPSAVPDFEVLLQNVRPDIVHFHDFSVGANLLHLRFTKAYGARTVMTYHSPGQSCLQRSLLYRGRKVCDGRISAVRCTECRMTVSNVPLMLRPILAALRGRMFNAEAPSRLVRALTARSMTERFQIAWREMTSGVDCIQVFSDWSTELMQLNGVPAQRLRLIRTGAPVSTNEPSRASGIADIGPLRLAYVGRCDEVKGVHVLVEAIRALPRSVPVEVTFFGPYWDNRYGRWLLDLMAGDRRFQPPVLLPHSKVITALTMMDLCIVPSIWLETGPLVILEAFTAGIPVIGSRLGGIAELVRDGVDGVLVPPRDSKALTEIIRILAEDRERLLALKRGVRQPRTMVDVAHDTTALYEELSAVRQAVVAGAA